MSGTINIKDKRYPKRLKEISNPPETLYYKGNWNQDIFEHCLAVVGSRKMTKYGEKICTKLVTQVAGQGITIVSGFMYGMDATAHKAAVKVGGRTIAVMPCGIDRIHPAYQKKLHKEILKKDGLIISEYEGDLKAKKWTYPKRNRIVAGLSQATLVVQAAKKSGSLITANYANKFNRKILAVPGPLTSSVSIGTANLIKKKQAEIVTEAKDILKAFSKKQSTINFDSNKTISKGENKLENKIINKLKVEPLAPDELSRKLNIPASKMGTVLSTMEIKGLIEEEGNKYHLE